MPHVLQFHKLAPWNISRCGFAQLRVLTESFPDFLGDQIAPDDRPVFLSDDQQCGCTDQSKFVAHRLLIDHLIG
jgi:hypothetical protein